MRTVKIAPLAQRQIDNLLRHGGERFGEAAAERYRSLIVSAIDGLAREPSHAAAKLAPVRRTAWMLHLRPVSRKMKVEDRVAAPRHLLVYRFTDDQLEIVQVLDDRMHLSKRLA